MRFATHSLSLETPEGIGILDIMPQIRRLLADSGIQRGFVTVSSNHTTTAVGINEL